jgi:hypothetical protein
MSPNSDSPLGQAIRNVRDENRDFKLLGKVAFDRLLKQLRERERTRSARPEPT